MSFAPSSFDTPIVPPDVMDSLVTHITLMYDGSYPNLDPSARKSPSHAKKRGADYIPRPPNSFLCFRAFFTSNKELLLVEKHHQRLSEITAQVWNHMSNEEKGPWLDAATRAKAEHKRLYPDYQYSPSPVMPRSSKRKMKKGYNSKDKRSQQKRSKKIANQIAEQPQICLQYTGEKSDEEIDTSNDGSVSEGSSVSSPSSAVADDNRSSSGSGSSSTASTTMDVETGYHMIMGVLPSKRLRPGAVRDENWLTYLNKFGQLEEANRPVEPTFHNVIPPTGFSSSQSLPAIGLTNPLLPSFSFDTPGTSSSSGAPYDSFQAPRQDFYFLPNMPDSSGASRASTGLRLPAPTTASGFPLRSAASLEYEFLHSDWSIDDPSNLHLPPISAITRGKKEDWTFRNHSSDSDDDD